MPERPDRACDDGCSRRIHPMAECDCSRSDGVTILAQADEFIAEMDDDGQVHVFDGEGVIRLSMPYDVWEAFTGDAISRRAM
ncbi:predicted ORF [Xanthomonas phage XacN1]|nr:predicted ORF [Xanthomonas phage XacN1]BBA65655.1 predicted ORF [Xanthomonas phage XacN1]